jgi:hypothetical protein
MPDRLHLHAARTRDAMFVDRGHQFAGKWTPATWALIEELTDMVAATQPDLPRRFAEFAVTRWILERGPIGKHIAAELEERSWELPEPRRDGQGFDQWTERHDPHPLSPPAAP